MGMIDLSTAIHIDNLYQSGEVERLLHLRKGLAELLKIRAAVNQIIDHGDIPHVERIFNTVQGQIDYIDEVLARRKPAQTKRK
jgi:hypothetical protein